MLTDAEKVAVRRYCGYPMLGGQAVQAFGARFFQHFGTLEFRLANMLAEEETVLREVYIVRLRKLEQDVLEETRKNLDTEAAAVWTHNRDEHADRMRLYNDVRRELCGFIGVPAGKGLGGGQLQVVV